MLRLILLRSHVRRNPPKPNRRQKQHKKQRPRFRHPTTSPNHHSPTAYALLILPSPPLPLSLLTTLPSLLPPPVIPASAAGTQQQPHHPAATCHPVHPTIPSARSTTPGRILPPRPSPNPSPPPLRLSLLTTLPSLLPNPVSFSHNPLRPPTHPLPLRPIHRLTARPRSPTRPTLSRPRPSPARRNHARRHRQRPHRTGRP